MTLKKDTCGIYKITNKKNNKNYIGKSIRIEHRIKEHLSPYNWKRENNKLLYLAFAKYGTDNFTFEVIEECEKNKLNEREKFWISYYNSNNKNFGYNLTPGGDGFEEENHPNHKLTQEDIIDIRTRYANKERKKDVQKIYEHKIGTSGFNKIWTGTTWSKIMPEVYTEENKNFHKYNTGQKGSENGRALLNEQQVYEIRKRKKLGENWQDVYSDYEFTGITKAAFQYTWEGYNWKHIVVE